MDSFRHMCILSGCDYLASVPGIGLGKALKLMRRFNKDPYRVSVCCKCLANVKEFRMVLYTSHNHNHLASYFPQSLLPLVKIFPAVVFPHLVC